MKETGFAILQLGWAQSVNLFRFLLLKFFIDGLVVLVVLLGLGEREVVLLVLDEVGREESAEKGGGEVGDVGGVEDGQELPGSAGDIHFEVVLGLGDDVEHGEKDEGAADFEYFLEDVLQIPELGDECGVCPEEVLNLRRNCECLVEVRAGEVVRSGDVEVGVEEVERVRGEAERDLEERVGARVGGEESLRDRVDVVRDQVGVQEVVEAGTRVDDAADIVHVQDEDVHLALLPQDLDPVEGQLGQPVDLLDLEGAALHLRPPRRPLHLVEVN